jgi:hypothetical protein
MKTLLWLLGIVAMLAACRQKEPEPGPTTIQVLVTDEAGNGLSRNGVDVWISGSTGSYFGGTRKDTIFVKIPTNLQGKITYQEKLESKWQVSVSVAGDPLLYNSARFEKGDPEGIVTLGAVNDFVAVLFKR